MNEIIFNGYGYQAAIAGFKTLNGPILSVTRNNKGKYLTGSDALQWAEHIRTAIDPKEAAALCRAIYNA